MAYPHQSQGFTIPGDSTHPRLTTLVSILFLFPTPSPCSTLTVLLSSLR